MSTDAYVTVEFERLTATGVFEMRFNLRYCGFTGAPSPLELIDTYDLPLVTDKMALPDWRREITETEYLELVGPPDLEILIARHRFLRTQYETWQKYGGERYFKQFRHILNFLAEFKRGNKPVRYTLTVSDMG